jgi:hypothetical protein
MVTVADDERLWRTPQPLRAVFEFCVTHCRIDRSAKPHSVYGNEGLRGFPKASRERL